MLVVASGLVRDEPSLARINDIAHAGLFDELPEAFDDKALVDGFALLHTGIERVRADKAGDAVNELKREWLRLFAGVGQPLVPSWANFYLDSESRVLGRQTLTVRNLYAKYGLEIEQKGTEPDDDLGLLMRFMAHLLQLETQGEDTREDQTTMLREHVLPWICAWRYGGEKHATSDFYRGVIEFTFGVVRTYASALGFSYRHDTRSFSVKG